MNVINKRASLMIFSVQALVVIGLYLILPGHVNVKRTAFQPDSINSICMGLHMSGASLQSIQNLLHNLAQHFTPHTAMNCGTFITPPYRTRLLLPLIIGTFSYLGVWWSVLLPSILIYFLIGQLYYRLLCQFDINYRYYWVVAYLPFMSLHITGFFANIMTEGLVVLFLLALSFFWIGAEEYSRKFVAFSSFFLGAGAIFTKQVWPVIAILWIVIIFKYFRSKNICVLLSTLSLSTAYALNLITRIIGGHLYGSNFGNWSEFTVFQHPTKAIWGNILDIERNLINCLTFFDPAFFIILYLLFAVFFSKSVALWDKCVLLIFTFWGLAVAGETYIVEGDRGDNWRFLSFAFFFVIPVLMKSKMRVILPAWIIRLKA
jgi:hypothetical protein